MLNLTQLQLPEQKPTLVATNNLNKRLGKRIEQFLINDFVQLPDAKIIDHDIQIRKGNQTIGELDTLINYFNQVIHLEISYKFYLYDSSLSTIEIEKWIGPNRNDSLIEKLTKLGDKQLPLLYSKEAKNILDKYPLAAQEILQRVYFKAQLFLPFLNKSADFNQLNENCVNGYYVTQNELHKFKDHLFYIPDKINWLVPVQENVDWQPFEKISINIEQLLKIKKSPLCWIKSNLGDTFKCFIVWW